MINSGVAPKTALLEFSQLSDITSEPKVSSAKALISLIVISTSSKLFGDDCLPAELGSVDVM